jgi:hypothetical protein
MRVQLVVQTIWPDFTLSKKRMGPDAWCNSLGLKDVEIKTSNIKSKNIPNLSNPGNSFFNKMSFMFDKQDRQVRRQYILGYDGLVFSIFLMEKLQLVFWTNHSNTLQKYKNIVKNKQKKFLTKWNEIQKNAKKSGNDAINIGLKDFDDDSIWNFYYKNMIYKDATLKEAKIILKVKN